MTNKTILLVPLFFLLPLGVGAQDKPFNPPQLNKVAESDTPTNNPILSMQAQLLANVLSEMNRDIRPKDQATINQFDLKRLRRRYHVLATIEMSPDATDGNLKPYHLRFNSRTGQTASVYIPTRKYLAFIQSGLALHIDISIPKSIYYN